MRTDLRKTQKELENEKLVHLESKDKAAHELLLFQQQAAEQERATDLAIQAPLQLMLKELAGSLGVLQTENTSMQQLQVKAIVANAPSRGD